MEQLRFNWYGDQATDHVNTRAVHILRACLLAIVREAKQSLSVAGTGRNGSGPAKRNSKGRFKATRTASAPGEPPRKQTGRLRASVTWELDEKALRGRAGTNVLYGMFLELGTKRGLDPRPWLRPAALKMRGSINALLATLKPD